MTELRPVQSEQVVFNFGGQNLTEAGFPDEARHLGIFVAQEVDPKALHDSAPDHWRVRIPDRDNKQAVCWDENEWETAGPLVSRRIHKSGKGDPNIPAGIRTPARWVHVKPLRHIETGLVVRVIFSHWINSWKPARRRDKWTAARARLAHRARRITAREMKRAVQVGDEFVCEGDFNSLVARLRFRAVRGVRVVVGHGLDRMYASKGLVPVKTWHLPKVGVGNQLRHKGLAARFHTNAR